MESYTECQIISNTSTNVKTEIVYKNIECVEVSMDSIAQRLKQLDELREQVKIYETQMDGFLHELGWTRDKMPKLTKMKQENEHGAECSAAGPSESVNDREITMKHHVQTDDLEAVVDLCSAIEQKRSTTTPFTDLNKLKRDLKRRRMKYRTARSGPLTYTEELRQLIELQMELIDGNK